MIKILIDSGCDVEKDQAQALGITVLPFAVRLGDEEYLDGFTLSHEQFFEKLIENADLPQTSQINEFTFAEKFEELTADGSEVVAITISSKLSGTYSSAVKAAKKFAGKVFVVDSLNACIGERILLDYALRLVEKGELTAAQIAAELNDKKCKIQLLAVLDTLKYLRKGGRISSVAAVAGEMLSIKPVISVVGGEVKLVGKAMGSKKGNNLLNQLVSKCGGIDFSMPYVLGYSGLSDAFLKKYIADSENLWKGKAESIPYYLIGSTIGTHVGPGAIAVAFFAN
ncbi:MAG TPA: DegV family protein [Candidatus Coproplasma excrementipullorum]|nr:DegV family protein [Candidatus Coproplasma excrementipullorum]